MDSKLKFTDVPEESSFYDLVSGDNILEIPLFQRPYMWKDSHFQALLADINAVDEETNSAVFLGIIVSFGRGSAPGRPPTWMIVDGQQRVTTLYLCIMAAVEAAARAGELEWAADTMGRYLLVRPMSGLMTNTKLVPSFKDRGQFYSIWERIIGTRNFSTHQMVASNPPKPPAPTGDINGNMASQYNRIRTDLSRLLKNQGLDALNRRTEIVATRLSVVSISLRDPTVAPKIFERLNYGAEPVTVADLVRNEVFARSGNEPEAAYNVFSTRWEPFVGRFSDRNADLDRFLFPYGLMVNPNVKKSDLFSALRKMWEGLSDPKLIIDDLEQYQPAYLSLAAGMPYEFDSIELSMRVNRIYRIGRPTSIFPFVIKLLRSVELKQVSVQVACVAFDVIESFLFRRAIGGIEPTGLHAVFKGLWQELCGTSGEDNFDSALSSDKIQSAIRSKATIAWPSNDEFAASIISGKLYQRKVVGYALREYEDAQKGESPQDTHNVEHIAPQTATKKWSELIPEGYDEIVHTWGNLLPLTSTMNPAAGQSDFLIKRGHYAESIFASARAVAKSTVWDGASIRERSKVISEWALRRWPY